MGATVYQRTPLTVEASSGYEDYYRRNLLAFRAEERIALAIPDIKAFVEVTSAS